MHSKRANQSKESKMQTPSPAQSATPLAPRKTKRRLPRDPAAIKGIKKARVKSRRIRPRLFRQVCYVQPQINVDVKPAMSMLENLIIGEVQRSRGLMASRVCHRIQADRNNIGRPEEPCNCECPWCKMETCEAPPLKREPKFW